MLSKLGVLALGILGLAACNSGKTSLGGGPEDDARLISEVFTWGCESTTTDSGISTTDSWQGVFAQNVVLEYAPDALTTVQLPSPGACTADLNMFPTSAGSGGQEIPDLSDEPEWATAVDQGDLQEVSDGFYKDEVFDNQRTCQYVEDILSGGTELTAAAALTGAKTPDPADMPEVTYAGLTADPGTGAETIEWGDSVTASWDAHDWDEVWVQIRREREGEAWESVTCNASGSSSFTVTSDIWGLMDETLNVEQNNLYVAFQKGDVVTMDDSQKVHTVTRAMAVAVVQD